MLGSSERAFTGLQIAVECVLFKLPVRILRAGVLFFVAYEHIGYGASGGACNGGQAKECKDSSHEGAH